MNQPTFWDLEPDTDSGGRVGGGYPKTSQRAGYAFKSGTQKAQIITHLAKGATAYELAGRIKNKAGDNVSKNQIAARLLELRENGFVKYRRDNGEIVERETSGGNAAQVQELTNKGWQAYRKIQERGQDA